MTRKNAWLAGLVTLALGAAAMLLLERSDDAPADAAAGWEDQANEEADHGPAASLSGEHESPAIARTELAGDAAAERDEDESPRPAIVVSGRVVSDGGAPVPGARVAATYRLSFDGARPRDFGGGERGRAFRPRPIGQAALTDEQGQFTLRGRALASSTLDVQVVHGDFAPTVVQREWQQRDGALLLGDIVVAPGAVVTGFVVEATGKGIAGAEVNVEPGDGGGPFGGRGGRGGRRRGGEDRQAAPDLVARAKTDATGFFRLEHVPAGRFRLQAEAARYLPALSEPLLAESATTVDAGRLQLVLGVELRGTVVDLQGTPIADARVEAGATRGGGERGGNRGAAEAGNGDAPDPRALAAAWRALSGDRRTRTDARGEFVLDGLPPVPLRVRAEHPRYVSEELQGIKAQEQQRVVFRLAPALVLAGRVVDADSAEPIEVYAVAAREYEPPNSRFGPGGGEPGARGRRGGDGEVVRRGRGQEQTEPGSAVAQELAARLASEQARRAQRAAYVQERLGSSGQAPRNPGRPAKHEGGRFTLSGLQPGRYVVDVIGPNHVGIAWGPIELTRGQGPAEVTIALRRGAVIRGLVIDKATREPLAGVRVELVLPDLDVSAQAAPTSGPELLGMFRRELNRTRVAVTRTDASGQFVLQPQRSGDYWLELEHDGYNTLVDRAVFVPDARPLELAPYALTASSEVFGRVLNALPDKNYTVTFWSTGGQRFTARADDQLGYRIADIEPGSYFVLLTDGSEDGAPGRRGPGGRAGARIAEVLLGNARPDVIVGEGAKVQFDVDARAQMQATVRGKVLLNGAPVAGFEVTLRAEAQPGRDFGQLGRFLGQRTGRTDEQGQFTIDRVTEGNYTLEVRRGGGPGGGGRGRGGPGGAVLHREPLSIAQGATIERVLAFAIGSVTFAVAHEADGKPVERGNVVLVLRAEAAGVPADQWRTLPSFTAVPLRSGAATVRELKLGEWAYRVQPQNLPAVEGSVVVDAAAQPMAVPVKVKPAGNTSVSGAK